MAHRLLTIGSGAALVLCVVLLILWVRSIGHLQWLQWEGSDFTIQFYSGDGLVQLLVAPDASLLRPPHGWQGGRRKLERPYTGSLPGPQRWGFGLHFVRTVGSPKGNWKFGNRPLLILYFPFWSAVTIAAIPPIWWARKRLLLRRRAQRHCCVKCGFDLRASLHRCPECGTPIPPETAPAAQPALGHRE